MAARAHWFDGRRSSARRGRAGGRGGRATTERGSAIASPRRADATRTRTRGRNRPAAPLHGHARAAAEGADDPLRRRPGPRGGAGPGCKAARPGNVVERARDVLETARAKGGLARAFARAARGPVTVPPDLPAMLEAALVRRIGELLGLARRAGQAVAGFEKAREWLRSGRAGLVVQAADGSAERTGTVPVRRRRDGAGGRPSAGRGAGRGVRPRPRGACGGRAGAVGRALGIEAIAAGRVAPADCPGR